MSFPVKIAIRSKREKENEMKPIYSERADVIELSRKANLLEGEKYYDQLYNYQPLYCKSVTAKAAAMYVQSNGRIKYDYITIGIAYHPQYHDDVKKQLTEKVIGHKRMAIGRSINCDGIKVGQVTFSKGISSIYGRRMLFHFSGEYFRSMWHFKPSDALSCVHKWIDKVVDDLGLPPDFYFGIEVHRLDYAIELVPNIFVDPWHVCKHLNLPGRMEWRDFIRSESGMTVYGGAAHKPQKNRSKTPLVRCYQYDDKNLRIEVEIPKVHRLDGACFGFEEAAKYAARIFEAMLPWPVQASCDNEYGKDSDSIYEVPVVDLKTEARPQEWLKRPYHGHTSSEHIRQRKMGLSLLRNNMRNAICADLLFNMTYKHQDKTIEFSEPEDEFEEIEVSFKVDPNVPDEVVLSQINSQKNSLEALVNAKPMELEDIDALLCDVLKYRKAFHPKAKPFEATFAYESMMEMYESRKEWFKEFLMQEPKYEPIRTTWELRWDNYYETPYYYNTETCEMITPKSSSNSDRGLPPDDIINGNFRITRKARLGLRKYHEKQRLAEKEMLDE